MPGLDDLRSILRRIDGRGYKAYRDIRGAFHGGPLCIHVDHVQGDPFAVPSRVRVRVEQSRAQLPARHRENPVRRVALTDYLARRVRDAIHSGSPERRGSGRSGVIQVRLGRGDHFDTVAIK